MKLKKEQKKQIEEIIKGIEEEVNFGISRDGILDFAYHGYPPPSM
ncbi:MAG TPA: hypothetical protein VMW81_02860 [Nitrospinota bacterium]|nr:hypothetical protein [Nitrospinota bacterium]